MNDTYILYGTQTGTAEILAEQLNEELEKGGIPTVCENIFEYKAEDMKTWKRVFIVISTWGDGDPPDDAEGFYADLVGMPDGALEGLEFSVLALGDTGYEYFCQCGINFDEHLERLGGKRLVKRVDCDIDYEEPAEKWIHKLVAKLSGVLA